MQLQTISDEYILLNRQLHDENASYGDSSWRHAQKVEELREDYDCVTVLDYGCGKGSLKRGLGNPDWMREYDPAVPGKDARPEIADLVMCTDVMEHIEPGLLDNVLTDLSRLAGKAAYLVIATRESVKLLPDGTSPHKIVQNAGWWRSKLEEKFVVLETRTTGADEVSMLVSPIRQITEIRSKSAVSDTIRFENALRNCSVIKERALGEDLAKRHNGRVCIVGFGPSLHQTWHYLQTERRAFGAKIVTVSGAHDFLISRGVIPDYHVEVDPREHKCFFTRNPHPDVTYWVASCCHPKLVDNLVEKDVKRALWHLYNSDNDFKIVRPKDGPDPGGLLVCGGSGVGARAVSLFVCQGYRSISLYGMDCSFANDDGAQHAAEHTGKLKPEWTVRVRDRWFRSSAQMVYMARSMVDQLRSVEVSCKQWGEPFIEGTTNHCEFFFHGDGLLPAMIVEGNRLGELEANNGNGTDRLAQEPDQPAQAPTENADHMRGAA
jgi:hypothetical protein